MKKIVVSLITFISFSVFSEIQILDSKDDLRVCCIAKVAVVKTRRAD